ncbi:DUF4142 domain-containing protein [Belliella marina]|uniref:DUF4142 domain-containing protein n=1 Tax=Belliella marina TaxID=1644146 RepID=A0ABW4VJB9_9BACT
MKNVINFKSVLVHTLCLAGPIFLASSCSENKTADSREIAKEENMAKLTTDDKTIMVVKNENDTRFLMDVAEMQLEEIKLGKLAQQNGDSEHVKELGKMMESDHTKSHAELIALAQSKSVSIPATVTEDSQDTYDKLADKKGNEFGKTYSKMMVSHHEDAIELFEKASTDSEDPEIRAWATKKLPTLRAHLTHAEACKEKCEKIKS